MEMDLINLISVLSFLTRRQLLKFMQANRYTYNVITKYFDKKPRIYAHFSLQKDYVDPIDDSMSDDDDSILPELFIHLTALNCDCEQQLSTNNLCTYKFIKGKKLEKFELNYHKNCPEWIKMENPKSEISSFRRESTILASYLQEHYVYRYGDCSIWKHPMHSDDTFGIKWICDEYKFEHRKQISQEERRPCAGLELRSADFPHIIQHLEADYIEIFKLDFGPYMDPFPFHQWNEKREYSNQEFEEYYKMLCWIVENKIITTNTVVEIDLNFLFIIFYRLQIEVEKQQFLLNSIAKCGQIQIHNFVDNLSDAERDEYFIIYPEANLFSIVNICENNEFLKNPLMVQFTVRLTPENILQVFKCYTDSIVSNEKPYRLFIYEKFGQNICAFLIEEFKKSQEPFPYFVLVPGNFKKAEHSTIYYNQITKECLRINAHKKLSSGKTRPRMFYYMARYQMQNSEAELKYKSFFNHLEMNAIRCEEESRLYNENREASMRDYGQQPPPQFLYSFSSFYAHFFPDDFGRNGELFNGENRYPINPSIFSKHYQSILPP